MGLTEDEHNAPMTDEIYSNPNRPEVQIIMYFYSMEPSFITDFNKVSITLDKFKINTLGPFARALFGIL